jgi:flagellar basal body rod protein FlgC
MPPRETLNTAQGLFGLPDSGAVEIQGDTNAVLGMIDLVTIQRAYAANVDALKALDGVLATVAGEVSR